jgi:phospholipid/cholesterol/gamma-HCH transport system permease protein
VRAASLGGDLDGDRLHVVASGAFTLEALKALDTASQDLVRVAKGAAARAEIALDGIDRLDTAGAWLLHRLEQELRLAGIDVIFSGARPQHAPLLDEVRRIELEHPPQPAEINPLLRLVAGLGRSTLSALEEARFLLSFFGQVLTTLARVALRPARLRLTSFTHHLEHTCLNALPIVGLISFLIGVVLAYQGAGQLRRFGAEIYTIDLLGVSVLREIGILLTAIVVAGRSGSAFTAQIGTMKVNQEVDALQTLGLDPLEILVLPRILALVVALPLLAFYADVLALLGGGLMCLLVLDIPASQFLAQLDWAVTPAMFWVGVVKAPVFAFLIAMVGCYEGLRVTGSAESVGRLTTKSVVVSIFLVIVTDAVFSILFSYLGI